MKYTVIVPQTHDIGALLREKVLLPFDDVVTEFIEAISGQILLDGSFRKYPELVSMAYWMRRANIRKLQQSFDRARAGRLWLGRGRVFHIAPSNVDSIFVYSWFLSMLVGNINIIRISSKTTPQMEALLAVLNEQSRNGRFAEVIKRFAVVRYDYSEEVTGYFSSLCDMRVIWGGDATVGTIRKIPLRAGAAELAFADKFSLCLIRADAFLADAGKDRIIENFYNDAYWFGQLACSSPRLVVWIGEDDLVEEARMKFWNMLEEKVMREMPSFGIAAAVDKLVAEYAIAIDTPGTTIERTRTALINRMLLKRCSDIRRDLHCGGGLFYEIKLETLAQFADVITWKDQTVGIIGFGKDEVVDFMIRHRPEGIDRIVPVGQALLFSPTWDGHDLLREFCREIDVQV